MSQKGGHESRKIATGRSSAGGTVLRGGPVGFSRPRTSRADVTGLNWSNIVVGGQSYSFVTPVKNQGIYDTCYAYASVAALESRYMITRGDPTFAVDLSEWMLVDSGAAGGINGGEMSPRP